MVWYKYKDLLGCIYIYKFIINKLIKKFIVLYWILLLKKNLKIMYDSYKYWILKKKKKYVVYFDLNKVFFGIVFSDTVSVDKWFG